MIWWWHDEEGAAEGEQDEHIEDEECERLLDNLEEHVDEESCLAENAKEVEDLDPHEKAGYWLHGVSDSDLSRAFFFAEYVS